MTWTQDKRGLWTVQDGDAAYQVTERGTACTCLTFNARPFWMSDCAHLREFRQRQGKKPIVLVPGSVARKHTAILEETWRRQ